MSVRIIIVALKISYSDGYRRQTRHRDRTEKKNDNGEKLWRAVSNDGRAGDGLEVVGTELRDSLSAT